MNKNIKLIKTLSIVDFVLIALAVICFMMSVGGASSIFLVLTFGFIVISATLSLLIFVIRKNK